MKATQTDRILDYIEEFGSITQMDALRDLGIMRLASRISDLKRKGYHIESETEPVKNRYGEVSYIKRYKIHEPIKVAVRVVKANENWTESRV